MFLVQNGLCIPQNVHQSNGRYLIQNDLSLPTESELPTFTPSTSERSSTSSDSSTSGVSSPRTHRSNSLSSPISPITPTRPSPSSHTTSHCPDGTRGSTSELVHPDRVQCHRHRTVYGAYCDVDDVTQNALPDFSNWIQITKQKLKVKYGFISFWLIPCVSVAAQSLLILIRFTLFCLCRSTF